MRISPSAASSSDGVHEMSCVVLFGMGANLVSSERFATGTGKCLAPFLFMARRMLCSDCPSRQIEALQRHHPAKREPRETSQQSCPRETRDVMLSVSLATRSDHRQHGRGCLDAFGSCG
jgi:hypothetical protein